MTDPVQRWADGEITTEEMVEIRLEALAREAKKRASVCRACGRALDGTPS